MIETWSLQKLFNETLFRIPDYQRGYSWSQQQLEEFWTDLTILPPNQDHYTGMLYLKKINSDDILASISDWKEEKWLVESGYTVYEVVDGQQRLTTLIILINEILTYCKKNNISELNSTLLTEIEEKYLYKIKPNNIIRTYKFGYKGDSQSSKYFRHVILSEPNGGTIEETFYTLNLSYGKDYFCEKIKNYVEKNGFEKLEELYKKITLKLKFNMYIVDDSNEFVAFETMNNRGKKLSYLELLKNRLIHLSTLFNNTPDEKQTTRDAINETWTEIYRYLGKNKDYPLSDDEFLQNHWIIYFGYQTRKIQGNQTIPYNVYLLNKYFIQQNIDPNNMYVPNLSNLVINTDSEELEQEALEQNAQEHETTNDKQICLSLNDIKEYVDSLKELIQYWYNMYFPADNYSPKIKKYLFRLKELGYVNARPLITVLLSKSDISDEDKEKCLKYIERFNFLHYRLNGYSSTYDNSEFYNLARDLYRDLINVDDVINKIIKIDYLSDNNVINSSGVVNKFEKLFNRGGGFYYWTSLKYLLYVYDISLTKTPSEQHLNPEEYFKQDSNDLYSVEHIYPQKAVNEYWTQRFNIYDEKKRNHLTGSLGNLLPLSQRINSKLQNNSFDDKKIRYSTGSKSEELVAQNSEWTPDNILNRGLTILSFAENEWEFSFQNLAEKKKVLGLDFMINKGDEDIDKNIPVYIEEEKVKKEIVYDEEQFKKLSSNTNEKLIDIFNELDNYILSLNNQIKKNTTSVYMSYYYEKNFIDLWFNTNSLKYVIMSGDYDDPKGEVQKLADSYRWTKNRYILVSTDSDIDYVKNILKQSYKKTNI